MLGIKRVKHFESFYNIASRAAQSNSVYVSVLKIPMVHADSVSKSLRQNFFFFARAAIVSAGKNNIFRDNNGYKQRLGPPVPKRRQFSDLFPWARVLKWGRKREKQRKRRLGISAVTIRFTSLNIRQLHHMPYYTSSENLVTHQIRSTHWCFSVSSSYLYAENGLVPWFLIFYVADTFAFSFTRYERKQFSFVCSLNI